jgi:hypothetical protein
MNASQLHQGLRGFRDWIRRLFRQPVFIFVTLWGHLSILLGAAAFQYFESFSGPAPHGFFSAYYWAISVATTVGSADVQPQTLGGKVVAVILMITGSLFLWSYTALFAASFVTPVMRRVGKEVHEIETEVEELGRDSRVDRDLLVKLIAELSEFNRAKRREERDGNGEKEPKL